MLSWRCFHHTENSIFLLLWILQEPLFSEPCNETGTKQGTWAGGRQVFRLQRTAFPYNKPPICLHGFPDTSSLGYAASKKQSRSQSWAPLCCWEAESMPWHLKSSQTVALSISLEISEPTAFTKSMPPCPVSLCSPMLFFLLCYSSPPAYHSMAGKQQLLWFQKWMHFCGEQRKQDFCHVQGVCPLGWNLLRQWHTPAVRKLAGNSALATIFPFILFTWRLLFFCP